METETLHPGVLFAPRAYPEPNPLTSAQCEQLAKTSSVKLRKRYEALAPAVLHPLIVLAERSGIALRRADGSILTIPARNGAQSDDLLALSILNYLRDRSKVRVTLQWNMIDTQTKQVPGLDRVTNIGKRVVYFGITALEIPGGTAYVLNESTNLCRVRAWLRVTRPPRSS